MQTPRHITIERNGDFVTVTNTAIGASVTMRNGIVVSRGGNYHDLTPNNIKSMEQYARDDARKSAA